MASKIHNSHDHSYKLLFSHPEMVRDLLTGFVKEDWVEHRAIADGLDILLRDQSP